MTADDARAAFAQARVAHLATTDGDGRPHVVPICFAADGDRIYTAVDHKPKTGRPLRRLENIAANPRVAVLADQYDDDDWSLLWWARADGSARVLAASDADGRLGVELLLDRYSQYRDTPPRADLIRIDVDRWTGWTG